MIEARVECLCVFYRVGDLNLTLRKGDVSWVEETLARKSVDLKEALRIQAVRVRWGARRSAGRRLPSPVVVPVPPAPVPLPPVEEVLPQEVAPKTTKRRKHSPDTAESEG